MAVIRPVCAADAERLTGLLTQLGYPSELDRVTRRLAAVLGSVTRAVLVAVPAGGSRIEGYIEVERRLALHEDDHVEITGLVVDAVARRSGLGAALLGAAEQWALRRGIHVVVVRSNVVRAESHPFYEGAGYRRKATSHAYRKQI